MKKLLFFITAIVIVSCSKSEPKIDDKPKAVKVEMIFNTGSHNSYGGYTVNSKDGSGFANINPSKTITGNFKVGDEITMTLNRYSIGGTGPFGIQLMVNNKLVKTAESSTSLKLEFTYKIVEEDAK